jgi:beta-glucosidase
MFPKGFLWGASTAAHQVEGGNFNDWTLWERAQRRQLAATGHERLHRQAGYGFSTEHLGRFTAEISDPAKYVSGRSCDHYHRYRDDFDLARSLNHTAHRFSIEWSRVEPELGRFDETQLDHYAEVINELKARGIEPVVTLWHWTLPIWFSRRGGFESKDSPALFARYVQKIVGWFGDAVTYWITLNEPTVYAGSAYYKGFFPPQKMSLMAYWKVLNNLVRAHKLAVAVIKKASPIAQVGVAHGYVLFQSVSRDPITSFVVRLADYVWNGYILGRLLQTIDFIGLNHYFGLNYQLWRQVKINTPTSDLGWSLEPSTLYRSIKELQRYSRPIIVTEHGCADAEDRHRGIFITESLDWLDKAITEGCDVRGYLHWSLLDNFEWDKGFWPRFGLIEVDYATLKRTIRPSAMKYAEYIESSSGS